MTRVIMSPVKRARADVVERICEVVSAGDYLKNEVFLDPTPGRSRPEVVHDGRSEDSEYYGLNIEYGSLLGCLWAGTESNHTLFLSAIIILYVYLLLIYTLEYRKYVHQGKK